MQLPPASRHFNPIWSKYPHQHPVLKQPKFVFFPEVLNKYFFRRNNLQLLTILYRNITGELLVDFEFTAFSIFSSVNLCQPHDVTFITCCKTREFFRKCTVYFAGLSRPPALNSVQVVFIERVVSFKYQLQMSPCRAVPCFLWVSVCHDFTATRRLTSYVVLKLRYSRAC
jgi:hypothetical protein